MVRYADVTFSVSSSDRSTVMQLGHDQQTQQIKLLVRLRDSIYSSLASEVVTCKVNWYHRIALNFRGAQFSRFSRFSENREIYAP